jgi:hypothetical protein
VLAFFVLGLLLLLRHALWQDEWQAWLIARDSASLAELFGNLRYEGHPALWYLPLYVLSRFTAQPLAMQLLHLGLATASVYVFLRFAPFTRLQKILFSFGYFPFFEYAVISRNYAAGVLLLFTYCAVFPRNFRHKYLVLAGILFLLCQTSVYGVLLALALAAALLVGEVLSGTGETPVPPMLAAGVILLAGVGLAILQLLPPPDSGFAVGWKFNLEARHALRTLGTFWESYVPVPAFQIQFWETNLIANPYLKAVLSLLLLGFACFLLRRRPAALTLFCLGALAVLSFTYTKYFGSLRHHGHLFLLLAAALWLSNYCPSGGPGVSPAQRRPTSPGRFRAAPEDENNVEQPPSAVLLKSRRGRLLHINQGFSAVKPAAADNWHLKANQQRNAFITAIFSMQLVAGLLAAGMGLFYPFSAGQETARFIREHGLAEMLIAGEADDAASVVSGYLNRPLYYLCADRWGTFVIWDNKRTSLDGPQTLQKARELAMSQRQEVLLVSNREIRTPEAAALLLRRFTRSVVPVETFYLYLAPYGAKPPVPPAATPSRPNDAPLQKPLSGP